MTMLLFALLGAALTANPPTAITNAGHRSNEISATPTNTNDPVEKEYEKLVEDDDAAQAEVDKWIQENNEFAAKGAGVSNAELNKRIQDRFQPIRQRYQDFIKNHPNHAKGHVAYASFLGDMHDEDGAQEQLEKALELDTNNPAVYNNLANIYGHTGPVKKAFEYYARAIELNPKESVYYYNFGTTVYLFRKDAREFYGITEQQVFDKALELYSQALKLDPTNFPLASDVAQTYYGIKPTRTEDALKSWTNALHVAHDEVEREGVYLHLARIKLHAERFDEARAHLLAVTNEMYTQLKNRLQRNIDQQEKEAKAAKATNAEPAKVQK
jgi:tetratricopeptide (TPR) repeat protein